MLLNSRASLDLLTLSRTALLIAANLFFADRAAAQGVIGWGQNRLPRRRHAGQHERQHRVPCREGSS